MGNEDQVFNLNNIKDNGKVNFSELVAEARIASIVAEEEELEQKDTEVQKLKHKTKELLGQMLELKEQDKEEERREVRNEIVVLNLRLVTQVLKKYGYFSPDKFQNGCVGLLKAADTFNPEKEVPFSNYAAFCIETEIRLAFRKQNRAFESKVQGYLDSLDAPSEYENGDAADKHDLTADPLSDAEFDAILGEADIDTLFYDIIIPCIEEYGQRSKDLDMELWRSLQLQYFLEMSSVDSQRQRITFTEMAKRLDTTPQNIRARHKKVLQLVREACEDYGFCVGASGGVYYEDDYRPHPVRVSKREAGKSWR